MTDGKIIKEKKTKFNSLTLEKGSDCLHRIFFTNHKGKQEMRRIVDSNSAVKVFDYFALMI